jgi:hypothetical protein
MSTIYNKISIVKPPKCGLAGREVAWSRLQPSACR